VKRQREVDPMDPSSYSGEFRTRHAN
jgi:hypothetical protein